MAENIQSFFQLFAKMQLTDYLDIICVAFLIYILLPFFRTSGATRIAKVLFAVLVLTWVTEFLQLHALNYIVNQLLTVGLIAIVVLFQPELRRMIDHLSNMKFKNIISSEKPSQEMVPIISQTVRACETMSKERVGALIVFARDNPLDEQIKTGTTIDAQLSEQLIRNIFFPKAALHDGAVVVRDGRISAAGCLLPLSESERLSADLGTRHRAGVGISEVSDAVVIIVSEETGAISVAVGGMLKRHLASQTLEKLLRNELCKEEELQDESIVLKLRQKLHKKEKGDSRNEK